MSNATDLPLVDPACEYCGDSKCIGRDWPLRCTKRLRDSDSPRDWAQALVEDLGFTATDEQFEVVVRALVDAQGRGPATQEWRKWALDNLESRETEASDQDLRCRIYSRFIEFSRPVGLPEGATLDHEGWVIWRSGGDDYRATLASCRPWGDDREERRIVCQVEQMRTGWCDCDCPEPIARYLLQQPEVTPAKAKADAAALAAANERLDDAGVPGGPIDVRVGQLLMGNRTAPTDTREPASRIDELGQMLVAKDEELGRLRAKLAERGDTSTPPEEPPEEATSWPEWCEEKARSADGQAVAAREQGDDEGAVWWRGRSRAYRDVANTTGTRIYGSRRSGTWTEEDRMAVISGVACLRAAGLRAAADRLDTIEHRMAGGTPDRLTTPLADAVVALRTDPDTWDRHDPNRPDVEPPPGTKWVYCYKPATGPAQEPGWRWEAIDDGLVDLVKQFQLAPAGHRPLVPTTGCCAGHREGERPHVLLADGRVLVVFDSLDEAERKTTEEPSRFASTIVSTVVSMRKAAEVEAQEAYDAGRAIANKVTEKWEEWALDMAFADPISDWDALRRDIRLLVDYALERGVRPDGKGGLVEDPAGAHALRDLGSNPAFESYDPEAHLEDLAAERSDVAPLKLDPPYRPSTMIVFLAGHAGDVVLDAGGLFRLLAGSADTIARLSTERWKERMTSEERSDVEVDLAEMTAPKGEEGPPDGWSVPTCREHTEEGVLVRALETVTTHLDDSGELHPDQWMELWYGDDGRWTLLHGGDPDDADAFAWVLAARTRGAGSESNADLD